MTQPDYVQYEQKAYDNMIYLGYRYLLKPDTRNEETYKKLDDTWKKIGHASFLEYVLLQEFKFESIQDALAFGMFMRTYWNTHKRLPNGMKKMINKKQSKMIRDILGEN